jgi:N-acetylglutamate synthase-like GNAT family acetyltransferase
MYKYRQANENDIDELLDMSRLLHARSPFSTIPWHVDTATEYWFSLIDSGLAFVVEDELGYLVACAAFEIGNLPWNGTHYICCERVLYVRESECGKGVGTSLVAFVQHHLKENELAHKLISSKTSTSPEHMGKWYESLGFTLIESSYMKEI